MTLAQLNAAPHETARKELLACCGSQRWASQLTERRPFRSADTLHSESEAVWNLLNPSDWLEAFAQHPKIGERTAGKWSAREQSAVSQATSETLDHIREMNFEYERRFGYIFIVCATGKSAGEIQGLLKERLSNEPATELPIAAREQANIMHLRLDKLLAE